MLVNPPAYTMMNPIEPIPALLEGVLAAMRLERIAGEWELTVHTPVAALSEQLRRLVAAFPWITVHAMEAGSEDGRATWQHGADGVAPLAWLEAWEPVQHGVFGMETTFDLGLTWIDEQRRVGRSIFPRAARWYLDLPAMTQTFTIWPNLFTDEINLYRDVGDHQFALRPFAFAEAAQRNRTALTASLRQWEQASGTIVSWDSDLISELFARGVADDAHAVPRNA